MIQVTNLSKQYDRAEKKALNNVSFTLHDGEMVGLIGQNGAGKSTLLKLLCKFITPTTGNVEFDNRDIMSGSNYLDDVGILLEPVFFPHLTAYENLAFYLDIHGKKKNKSEIDGMLDIVGLLKNKNEKPGDFSFGMKQRLGLAQALLGDPKILILDEPFVGLDPTGVKELISILKQRVIEKQMQAIISSHQLFELNEICERVLVLHNGELVFDGIPDLNPEITFVLNREYAFDIDCGVELHAKGNQVTVNTSGDQLDLIIGELHKKYNIINLSARKSALEKFFEES